MCSDGPGFSAVARPAEVEGRNHKVRGTEIAPIVCCLKLFYYGCQNCANLESFITVGEGNITGVWQSHRRWILKGVWGADPQEVGNFYIFFKK